MAYEAYANGWPDLKQLQELAEKVGNIPTFTSSDKEAIEDLIANAQALIEVAEDGAAGVPFDNTGTEFSSTDVQGAIEEAATIDTNVYSTTAVKVGKWGNKDLFRKVIENIMIPTNTTSNVYEITNEEVKHMWGMSVKGGDLRPIPFAACPGGSGTSNDIRLDITSGNIRLQTFAEWTGHSAYIVIEYTISEENNN